MAKISPALRERLMAQKKGMQRGGMLIRNKDLTRMKLRILPPPEGELPGVENISFYSATLKKGSTSPMSWDVPCPVADALDRLYREGSKDDKEAANKFCRRSVEYWIAVIDRADEGTPQNPRLRILQGKQGVYQKITDWMLDEEDGEDITDPIEGRDITVKKTGSGLETEWTVDKGDKSPISEDEDMANAWVELASTFDVRSKFYIPKLEVLEELYSGLTGEKIPATYRDPILELIEQLKAGGHVDPDSEYDDTPPDASVGVEVVDATPEAEDGDITGQTVQFENEGAVVQGVVLGADGDEAGNWLVVEDGGSPDEPWSIPEAMLTVVAAVEETQAEEVQAPPPVKKKVVAAAPASATPKPVTAPKPSVTKTSIPAKPAAATKPVAGLPRKPGVPSAAPAGKASSSIKASLRAKQGKK